MLFQYNHPNLHCNVSFRLLVMNIDCDNTVNFLDGNDEQFVSHYQNILIVKEIQKTFGEMYLGGKKIIMCDYFFIVTNKRIDHHMDAEEFKRLFYNFCQKFLSRIRELISKAVNMI